MALLYDYKKRRQAKKEAKIEAGKKGKKGKKIDEKYQKKGSKGKKNYQGTGIGRAIRKTFTKSKYGLKPVGRGGGQPLSKKIIERPDKPEMEAASTSTKRFTSSETQAPTKIVDGVKLKRGERKDIGVQEDKSKRTAQKARTAENLKAKTGAAARRVNLAKGATKTGESYSAAPEIKRNVAKQSEYDKKKAEYQKKKEEGKYVPHSRTQSQRAKDASLDLARSRATKAQGEGKGTRNLYRTLKKKKIAEMKKRKKGRRVSPMAKF